jgi:ribosomal-protein-serine acetyltransferase
MQISETTTLEPIAGHHAEPVFELIAKSRSQLETWLSWVTNVHSVADFQNFLKGAQQRVADKMAVAFFIRYDGKIAGNIGLYHIDHLNKIASIGYWLGEEFQGKGIITNACQEIVKYGFSELNLNRIEIKCGTRNVKSQAIPERLGFTQEGIIRQAELVNGKFHDLYLYSLLKEDWEKNP